MRATISAYSIETAAEASERKEEARRLTVISRQSRVPARIHALGCRLCRERMLAA
jgi:hypothetical protein